MATKQLPGDRDAGSESLSRTETFELLSNRRRRYAWHAVRNTDEPTDISDLAEQVAAWENGKSTEELTSDERHRVYTSMQQNHLPALDRAGIIEYDKRTVEPTEAASDLDVYIDVVPEESIPWGEYYLGLSLLTAGLLGAVYVGIFPDSIPMIAWPALFIFLFLGSATYHVRQSRQMRVGAEGPPPELRE